MISRLYTALRSSDLTQMERIGLQRDFRDLQATKRLINRPHEAPKRPQKAKIALSNRTCVLCGPIPPGEAHDKRKHAIKQSLWCCRRAAHEAWRRRGWGKLWQASVASRYRRAIERRSAIFRDLAPISASKMTPNEVEIAINKHRYPPTNGFYGLRDWRNHVRKHYR